jgi:hypothetical protein
LPLKRTSMDVVTPVAATDMWTGQGASWTRRRPTQTMCS